MIVPMTVLLLPYLPGDAIPFDIDLMLRSDLNGIFIITVRIYHPTAPAVLSFHAAGNHVLVLFRVDENERHPVGSAALLIDPR